jgi:polyphosphate glucokinase
VTEGLGIDIGGTGVKAALVDLERGLLVSDRHTAPTPRPARPQAVAETAADLVRAIGTGAPAGFGFPGVVQHGVTATAANLHPDWVGLDACELFSLHLGRRPVTVMNDADAAGLAEMRHGAGMGHDGVTVMITLGTGIGTAVFTDGILVPNSEFGHLIIDGVEAEHLASSSAKERRQQDWRQWSGHLSSFLKELERLIWPDLIIIGGGISAEFRRFCSSLDTSARAVPARLGNDAGIVGAAMAMREGAGLPSGDRERM